MTRFVVLAVLCLGASTSRADGMLPGGATLKFNKLLFHEHNSPDLAEPEVDPDSKRNYFNLAHCVCSFFNYNPDTADATFFEKSFAYEITVESFTTPIDRPVEIWTGTACNTTDTTQRAADCHKVLNTVNVSQINANNLTNAEIPLFDLFVPKIADRPGCQEREVDGTTWAMVDSDGDSVFDYSISDTQKLDTKPPQLPTNFTAVGAENAVEISWSPPDEGVADIAYYQALCATTLSGAPVGNPKQKRYLTPRQLCGAQQDVTLKPSAIATNSGTDAGTTAIDLPQELAQLDAAFICGESTSPTATSMRITGLQNNVDYTVVFLAIDLYGNANGTFFTSSLVPKPATDFWEDLHNQGSDVEGGFCLIAQTYGDDNPLTDTLRSFRDNTLADTAFGRWLIDVYYKTIGGLDLHGSLALRIFAGILLLPLVAIALLWHLLTLPGLLALIAFVIVLRKRRRVMARFAVAATLAVIALAPARARAQTPYWDEPITSKANDDDLPIGDPDRVTWHAGVRIGPYVPGIDAQLDMPTGKFAGPYEQMFGGWAILPMLDVEYFFLRPMGQLGVGVSLGYMGKKAHAWEFNSDPMDPNRPRSAGDSNTFRLFPLSVNAVYRFTYLDDAYGVPLVPYARAGLAYYIWWVKAPNGDFAKACVGGGMDPTCTTTSAAGASAGFVGSIGLALRAERVDEAAARSMRETGIEHAGFYAEYSIGVVDGFGSSKKLAVGDATWFAGIDFEF